MLPYTENNSGLFPPPFQEVLGINFILDKTLTCIWLTVLKHIKYI